MWFVKQTELYDVIVTENLFGDVITDLAAIIQVDRKKKRPYCLHPKMLSFREGKMAFEPTRLPKWGFGEPRGYTCILFTAPTTARREAVTMSRSRPAPHVVSPDEVTSFT